MSSEGKDVLNKMRFSRRQFLATTGMTAGSAFLALRGSTRAWAAPSKYAAGIQLYTVNEPLTKDPRGTLTKLAAIGYREVEAAGFANLSAAEFRKLIDGAGLHCPSAHLEFGFRETGKLLEDANTLGVRYAVSSVLPPSPPPAKIFLGF